MLLGWIVAAYLAGALALVMIDSGRWRGEELLALIAWPVMLPIAFTTRRWRHWRYTCRDCGGYYGDREHYDLHLRERVGCTVANQQVGGDRNA